MLFSNGIIWDDWTVMNMPKEGLSQQFGENGFWFLVYFHDFLNDCFYSPIIYHWMSFGFMFGVFVFVFKILKHFKFKESSALLITLLAMLTPYFETKNLIICMPHTMFLFSFTFGLYLIFSSQTDSEDWKKLLVGAVLVFFSFFLNSIIPMFLFVTVFYLLWKNDFSILKIKENSRKEILLGGGIIMLPFVFWGVKKMIFPVKGLYAASGYNKINFSLTQWPIQIKKIAEDNIIGIYNEFISVFEYDMTFSIVIFLFCLVVSVFILRKISFKFELERKSWQYAIFGILLFFVGAFPYIVVNKLPRYYVYDTRHQILLCIGLAFLVYSVVVVFHQFISKGIFVFIISVFMTNTISSNINFLRGWIKIEAVKHDIKQIEIDTSGIIITKGFDGQLYATENPLTFYELSGIFKKTLDRQDLYYVHHKYSKRLIAMFPGISAHAIKFNMKDYDIKDQDFDRAIEATYAQEKISYFKVLEMVMLYYFNQKVFQQEVDDIMNIEIKKV
ncbi:hypothetical protein [uncultured Aquimarina sp.]|uniref:hypothetical protein n=1 Tax=uncultured Aquimarina sp. TaxID=575652 RepID=UPI002619B5F4|nr:hypothetical protein [uncultured Aquimarina sp.]